MKTVLNKYGDFSVLILVLLIGVYSSGQLLAQSGTVSSSIKLILVNQ